MEKNRAEWGSRMGFILAAIGSAIGLGNIWRFPYVVVSNGGGAFLIPYIVALLTAGIPILILEFALGHKIRKSAPGILGTIGKKWGFLGWFQSAIAFFISSYYVVIIAWAASYTIYALNQSWGVDTKDFLFKHYLEISESPMHLNGINYKVLLPLFVMWGVNYVVLRKGVKNGIEKANKIFMPLLICLLLVIVVRGVTLPGAVDGLNYFFTPDFSALANPKAWLAAYTQIFFTLSIAFGIMLTYSSYLPKESDIVNNAFLTGFGNCSFSLITGIGVFAILGHMAMVQGVAVKDVSAAGVGFAFVVFPQAINALSGAKGIIGILFFLCLIFAGISSSVSIIETVVASLQDRFNLERKKAINYCVGGAFLFSLIIATRAGLYILDIADYFLNNYAIAISGLLEIVLICWIKNPKEIIEHVNPISEFRIGRVWEFCVKYLTPCILSVILVLNVLNSLKENYEGYSTEAILIYGIGVLVIATGGAFVLHKKSNYEK
ncbi:sodium-dependent transporter [uncultured Cetobacterium sp.]|uniref:sodium-dependent transporter n=1 Tax=uncultured Cetobacterium sp. TaxID=527638 RepID=UPI002612D54A|nr:sodium-dependent transporter [uncultured Cetobacterium sp.]